LPSAGGACHGGRFGPAKVDRGDGVLAVERVGGDLAVDVRPERIVGVSQRSRGTANVGRVDQLRQPAARGVPNDVGVFAKVVHFVQFDLRPHGVRVELQRAFLRVRGGGGKLRDDRGCQHGHDHNHDQHFN